MGTELQYALNLFSTSHGDIVNIETEELWARKRLSKDSCWTGFDQIRESMDRTLEQYNRESMKEMMLKQEEIFKEQVSELHRLYRVQKTLMAEVRNKMKLSSGANAVPQIQVRSVDVDTTNSFWSTSTGSSTSRSPFSNSRHNSTQMNLHHDFHQRLKSRASPSSQEPTSCSRDSLRLHREFDLEQPAEEDISTSINVIKEHNPTSHGLTKNKMTINDPHYLPYCDDAESDIELTLSIGCNTDKKEQKHRSHRILDTGCSESNHGETSKLIPSVTVRSDKEGECTDTIPSAAFEQERIKCPRWLLQSMSLNRT